nr:unnamed protein product [Digitaria exilis]
MLEEPLWIASRITNSGKRWFRCPICPDVEKGSSAEVINHAITIVQEHDKLIRAFFNEEDVEEEDAPTEDIEEEDAPVPATTTSDAPTVVFLLLMMMLDVIVVYFASFNLVLHLWC